MRLFRAAVLLSAGLLVAYFAFAQSISEFPVAGFPNRIVAGPDGQLWFSKVASASIGSITTSGNVTETSIPGGTSLAIQDLAFDLDGNMWFAEDIKIGRLPRGGLLAEFSLPPGSRAFRIVAGPDGNVWFTDPTNRRIGKITQGGSVTEFGASGGPYAITAGPDGNLWFTETGNAVGRITPAGAITEFPVGPDENPYSAGEAISVGPDGAIWFPGSSGKIQRITTSGIHSEFAIPRFQNQELGGITAGPDGNLWFTEGAHPIAPGLPLLPSKIGRITPAGVITEFLLPNPFAHPIGIASGPDGNLWVAEFYASKIARIPPTLTPCDRCIRPIPFRQDPGR